MRREFLTLMGNPKAYLLPPRSCRSSSIRAPRRRRSFWGSAFFICSSRPWRH